ncbi:Protein CBG21186 [Caenorhabditis briggsae]|uniref:Uncharacterized protein n=2 Tax=Caenorhabditis briggsae TaxID=6238 RepID=A0AAE9DF05_CAEBR|nr:Protein CBG21186 [Caenorhabditis briggsae]ULU03044.1 hypothetical protein L3Y34_002553 [Caenorhabditis briggsae]CAP38033.1 Protein CBG21186 [Caenorhabditis briggsae]
MLNMSTKDLMMESNKIQNRRFSDASTSSNSSSDDMDLQPQPIAESRRRDSLIEQFRDFLSRSVDFSFKIDNPFEKEMY